MSDDQLTIAAYEAALLDAGRRRTVLIERLTDAEARLYGMKREIARLNGELARARGYTGRIFEQETE